MSEPSNTLTAEAPAATTPAMTQLAAHRPSKRTTQCAIQEASEATGWSPRMLRYVESLGLVRPDRSPAGYRLFSSSHLDRLRSLRKLVERYGIELGDAGFAVRLHLDGDLHRAVDAWILGDGELLARTAAAGSLAARLVVVPEQDWLGFEQDKQLRLLAVAGTSTGESSTRRRTADPRITAPPAQATTTSPIAGRKEIA